MVGVAAARQRHERQLVRILRVRFPVVHIGVEQRSETVATALTRRRVDEESIVVVDVEQRQEDG